MLGDKSEQKVGLSCKEEIKNNCVQNTVVVVSIMNVKSQTGLVTGYLLNVADMLKSSVAFIREVIFVCITLITYT